MPQHANQTSFKKGHKINLGRPCSKEKAQRISIANKGRISHNKGKPMSEEQKEKISKSNKGRIIPLEIRRRISNTLKGKKLNQETKLKLSIIHKKLYENHPEIAKMHRNKTTYQKGHRHSKEVIKILTIQRRYKKIPKKNTRPEKMMQIAISLEGIKYRTHEPILGQPDIFIEPNICIFIDGEYWHSLPKAFKRDNEVNTKLNELGYHVIRIREKSIYTDVGIIAKNIINLIKQITIGTNKIETL